LGKEPLGFRAFCLDQRKLTLAESAVRILTC
jgi:hypothetical protein